MKPLGPKGVLDPGWVQAGITLWPQVVAVFKTINYRKYLVSPTGLALSISLSLVFHQMNAPDKKGPPGSQAAQPKVRPDMEAFRSSLRKLKEVLRLAIGPPQMSLLVILFFLITAKVRLTVRISRLLGESAGAVATRQWTPLIRVAANFFVSSLMAVFTDASVKFIDLSIQSSIRQRLVHRLQKWYFRLINPKKPYYELAKAGFLAEDRLSNGIQVFALRLISLFHSLVKPICMVIVASRTLYGTIGSLQGPFLIQLYFLAASRLVDWLSPNFLSLSKRQAHAESMFRASQARVAENAEEIAILGGEQVEEHRLNQAFDQVLQESKKMSIANFKQTFLNTTFFKYGGVGFVFSTVSLPLAFGSLHKDTPLDEIVAQHRTSDQLMRQVADALADLLSLRQRFQALFASLYSIHELMENVQPTTPLATKKRPRALVDTDLGTQRCAIGRTATLSDLKSRNWFLRADDLCVTAPNGRLLISQFSLRFREGENVLLTGPNGSGKTSLLRVIAGVWLPSQGSIIRNIPRSTRASFLYLPQKAYMVSGTLMDQVVYPILVETLLATESRTFESLEAEVDHCLAEVGLGSLNERYGKTWRFDWKSLSGGEQQRLAVARLIFHTPVFAILDEATSQITGSGQEEMYSLVISKGITLLSCAHRSDIFKFHQLQFKILGLEDGSWTIDNIRTKRRHSLGRVGDSSAGTSRKGFI